MTLWRIYSFYLCFRYRFRLLILLQIRVFLSNDAFVLVLFYRNVWNRMHNLLITWNDVETVSV